MLSFDYVYLGQLSHSAQYGIRKFFDDYMEEDYPGSYIYIDQFCFLIELLKNLEEEEDSEYFPSGKWATIQVMQTIRDKEIKKSNGWERESTKPRRRAVNAGEKP